MKDKEKFGKLDASSKKDLDLMEDKLRHKYEEAKKMNTESSKIA